MIHFRSILLTVFIVIISLTACTSGTESAQNNTNAINGPNNFYKSDLLDVKTVKFKNQYQMEIEANLYIPKNIDKTKTYPAIVVGHPMGAVKEQSANLYAQKMAEKGFITLSIDLSFWGGSQGLPRNAVSPDMYAETYSAGVDYLRSQSLVNKDLIGAIGICGGGSFVISAAKIDPRIKAIATVSMYDMGDANRNALNSSLTKAQRKQIIIEAAEQRDIEFIGGPTKYTSGSPHQIEENNPIGNEFYDFYRTPRGEFTPEGSSKEITTHPTLSSNTKFMNFYPFNDIDTIDSPMLFITGSEAHSIEFSQKAYKLASEPKELYVVPGAGHVDLYDNVQLIPFEKLEDFFKKNLKS